MTDKEKDVKEKTKKSEKKTEEEEQGLTEEDRQLKERLETLVKDLSNDNLEKAADSLVKLKTCIREATSSMSQVPKPLKFLMPLYDEIKELFDKSTGAYKKNLADLMSVLSMTNGKPELREVLKYRLLTDSSTVVSFEDWGHEYVRHIVADICEGYQEITSVEGYNVDDPFLVQIKGLIPNLCGYLIKHRAEEACDLLIQADEMDKIVEHVTEHNYERVTGYLIASSAYLHVPDNTKALEICYEIFMKLNKGVSSLRMAIKLDSSEKVKSVFTSFEDELTRKQLAYYLTWCNFPIPFDDDEQEDLWGDDAYDDFEEILANKNMHQTFDELARELDVKQPKTPDEIYKEGLVNIGSQSGNVLSARKNLASTYVNAFVNCGFQNDKLMSVSEAKGDWIYQNKEGGMLAAAASLGLINFWSPNAVNTLEPYVTNDDPHIKAGAFLGQGMSAAGYDENVVFELLKPNLESSKDTTVRVSIILGLGFGHCGKSSEECKDELLPYLYPNQPSIVRAATAIALGMIFIGTQDDEIMEHMIFELLAELPEEELETDSNSLYYALCLGLLYFKSEEDHDTALQVISAGLEDKAPKLRRAITVMMEACAFAGTGNVLLIQKMMSVAGEHPDEPEKKSDEDEEDENKEEDEEEEKKEAEPVWHQSLAVIGLALVAMGEKYGNSMLVRVMNHLVQYGEPCVRRAIPLCLSLAFASNPDMQITDLLTKLSHDNDLETVNGAILGLGLVAGGTNNSRVASLLRSLMEYHQNHPDQLYLIRIALGLLHAGKGLITFNPLHSHNMLLSKTGVAGLLTLLVSCLDFKNNLLGDRHYLLYSLCVSIRPRMLTILNEKLEPMKIDVRVGMEVDIVGMVGDQKPITAFQTHETPVILGVSQRAELVNPDKYIAMSPILEGFVIVKENPDYEEEN